LRYEKPSILIGRQSQEDNASLNGVMRQCSVRALEVQRDRTQTLRLLLQP
jgi:hypothetical protein